MPIVVQSSPYPQSGLNPTRGETIARIASYYGGENRPTIIAQAAVAWEDAIDEYNTWLWRFNRVVQDIDLASPSPTSSATYDLASDFAEPNRAKLVDADGKERDSVTWVHFPEWTVFYPDQVAPSSRPIFYTAQNQHETGKVTVYPRLNTSSLQWPTMRLYYFRRILVPEGDGDRLNVPKEVAKGIFKLAVAIFLHARKGMADAAADYARAGDYRLGLEHRFRDFPDF